MKNAVRLGSGLLWVFGSLYGPTVGVSSLKTPTKFKKLGASGLGGTKGTLYFVPDEG